MSSQESKLESFTVSQVRDGRHRLCAYHLSMELFFCIWLGPFWWLVMKICVSYFRQKGNIYHVGHRMSHKVQGRNEETGTTAWRVPRMLCIFLLNVSESVCFIPLPLCRPSFYSIFVSSVGVHVIGLVTLRD